jgi:hypothetical protein
MRSVRAQAGRHGQSHNIWPKYIDTLDSSTTAAANGQGRSGADGEYRTIEENIKRQSTGRSAWHERRKVGRVRSVGVHLFYGPFIVHGAGISTPTQGLATTSSRTPKRPQGGGASRFYAFLTGFPFPLGPTFTRETRRYEVRRSQVGKSSCITAAHSCHQPFLSP